MSIRKFPERWSQAVLVGIILVGRLGVGVKMVAGESEWEALEKKKREEVAIM